MKNDNKNLNIFWKSLTVSIVTGLVILCVTYLLFDYPTSSGSNVVNISFIKDIYSIIFSIFAPFIAIYLFNDWKDQHNKTQLAVEAKDFIKTIDKDVKIFSHLNVEIKNLNPNIKIKQQEKQFLKILDQLNTLSEVQNDIISKSGLFRNLSGDEDLFVKIQKYNKLISDMVLFISSPTVLTNITSEAFISTMLTNIRKVIILNGEIKREFKTYIILE